MIFWKDEGPTSTDLILMLLLLYVRRNCCRGETGLPSSEDDESAVAEGEGGMGMPSVCRAPFEWLRERFMRRDERDAVAAAAAAVVEDEPLDLTDAIEGEEGRTGLSENEAVVPVAIELAPIERDRDGLVDMGCELARGVPLPWPWPWPLPVLDVGVVGESCGDKKRLLVVDDADA